MEISKTTCPVYRDEDEMKEKKKGDLILYYLSGDCGRQESGHKFYIRASTSRGSARHLSTSTERPLDGDWHQGKNVFEHAVGNVPLVGLDGTGTARKNVMSK